MKNILLILACLLPAAYAGAQPDAFINVRFAVKADTVTEQVYKMPVLTGKDSGSAKVLALKMNYNESGIQNAAAAAEELSSGFINISAIDLVYTQDGNDELLEQLNKRRLFELYMLAPDIFSRSMIKWRFVKQTGEGQNIRRLFHGFVIHYRKIDAYHPLTAASLKKDVEDLSKRPGTDLITILKRLPSLEQQTIVVDFTGSMSPYFKDLMSWFFLKKYSTATNFVFFNDGDKKANHLKVAGKTGGLYSFRTNDLDTILQQAIKSIDGGNGGDSPENDVEAILKGIKDNPKTAEVVLIADNWADMRDYALISTVKKPVRVILCGTEEGINTQYLDLARATGGSVHTIEDDIEDLKKVSEGHEVRIKNETFIYSGGRFRKK